MIALDSSSGTERWQSAKSVHHGSRSWTPTLSNDDSVVYVTGKRSLIKLLLPMSVCLANSASAMFGHS